MKTRTIGKNRKNQGIPAKAEAAAESIESSGGPGFLELLQFGSRAILQQAVEEEITRHLGRENYERLAADA